MSDVTRILQQVEARWVDEGFPPRERVLQLLADVLPPGKGVFSWAP